MKIKYLGTAAAEGFPALFCLCPNCLKARRLKGKNVRSRHQVLVNDDLLIDYPPDSFYHFQNNDIDCGKIKDVLISHAHEDHFYPLDFAYFLSGFSHPSSNLPFTVTGSIDLYEPLKNYLNSKDNQGLRFNEVKPFIEFNVGKYKAIALKANHGTANPYIYIVSDNSKTILYCHDSGLLPAETVDYLKSSKIHFDLLSLDCTEGSKTIYYQGHMNLERNRATVAFFKENGLIDDKTKIVLSHFSHNGHDVLYDEMVNAVKEEGFIVAYDGLEIEI